MKKINTFLVVAAILTACSSTTELPKDQVYNVDGIAIDGYDPVAYFEQGEAKKGVAAESFNYNGLVYHFSSTKNRLLFMENPDKFLPNYGGWCAYAVAETSTKMQPDPAQWQINDGELILFTSNFMTTLTGSLKEEWNEDPAGFETRADDNWSQMSHTRP